jgi:AsmA protein
VNHSPQGTSFSNIDAEVPRIGSATGSGTVSPTDDLNFQLNARIAALSALGGALGSGAGSIGGLLGIGSNSTSSSQSNSGGIPLTVTGTASNPSIHANVGKILKNAVNGFVGNSQNQQNPIKALKGLFGR